MTIDAHQHFWQYDPLRDSWIKDAMQVIRRDFMPEDLKPVLEANHVESCIAVQAAQDNAQTTFLLQLAQQNNFIKGVVGWIDLQATNLLEQLAVYDNQPLLKGFRHVLQDEPDDAFMLRPAFLKGVQALRKAGFTYDILVFPKHLPNAIRFVRNCDNQPLVLDHLAKPYIKDGLIDAWKRDLTALATHDHVHCKISGLLTEAN